MTDHKINIVEIEHIEHASRIIITYELLQDTANFDSPGWMYIADGCGYRDICSDEWMCIEPNGQHPLHSDEIKSAGIYYFVWDYHGVNGLSNSDFSSERSFLIQLALQDTGVGWVDPCVEDPNYTADGDIVDGYVGTSGNCGEGWLIDLDYRGCLICVEQELCDNTVPTGPYQGEFVDGAFGEQGNCGDGYHIEYDMDGCPKCVPDGIWNSGVPPIGGPPPPAPPPTKIPPVGGGPPFVVNPRPSPQTGPGWISEGGVGGGGGDGGAGGGVIQDDHESYFGEETPGFSDSENLPRVNDTPDGATAVDRGLVIRYESGPIDTDSSSGGDHGSGVDHGGVYGKAMVLANLPSWMTQGTPNDPDGDGTYTMGHGKIVVPPIFLSKGSYGGRSPHLNNITNFGSNQRYNKHISSSFGGNKLAPSENEMRITTRHFKGNDGTINVIAGGTTSRSKSVPSDAISVDGMRSFVSFPTATSTANGVIRVSSAVSRIPRAETNEDDPTNKYVESRPAEMNVHAEAQATTTIVGSTRRVPLTSSFENSVSIADRNLGRLTDKRDTEHAEFFGLVRKDPEFTNRNKVGISVVPRTRPVGGSFHAVCYAVPYDKKDPQTFTMSLYAKDATGITKKIASTGKQTATTARRIAAKVPTANLSPGAATIYFAILDSKNNIIHTEGHNVIIDPPGQTAGPPNEGILNSGFANRSRDYVSGLIKKGEITSLDLPIGSTDRTLNIIAEIQNSPEIVRLGAQIFSLKGRREYKLAFYETGDLQGMGSAVLGFGPMSLTATLLAENTPLDSGPNINGNPAATSSVLYFTRPYEEFLANDVLLTVSNRGGEGISYATIEVGADLKIKESSIVSIIDAGGGEFYFSIQTPFVLTPIYLFQAGGNNLVSSSPALHSVVTDINGVLFATIPFNEGAWIAMALQQPAAASLAARTFFFDKPIS